MKKLLTIILMTVLILCGCENKKDIYEKELKAMRNQILNAQKDYEVIIEETQEIKMKETVKQYLEEKNKLQSEKNRLTQEVNKINKDVELKKATIEGRTVYLITVQLKQSHLSLDPGVHIKDSMNAVEFQFPTNKEYYDSVKEGQKILEKFRSGSFWVEGSFGDWNVTAIKKEIIIKKEE